MIGPLHILGHTELGDAIVMNGLLHYWKEEYGRDPILYVNAKYVKAVRDMLGGMAVRPSPLSYDNPHAPFEQNKGHIIRLGFFNGGRFDPAHWDSEFYRQADVPFEARWGRFKLPKRYTELTDACDVLVHECPERGYTINRKWLPPTFLDVNPVDRPNFLGWVPSIYGAKEIHVVDSFMLCLVDSLPDVKAKKVFHAYAKTYSGHSRWPQLKQDWTILL